MSKIYTSGDSVTVGDKSSTAAKAYAALLAAFLGMTRQNYAVGGDMAADQSARTQLATLVPGDVGTIMVGINDHKIYKGDVNKHAHYKAFLRRIVGNFVHPTRASARASSKTGAWSNSDSATGIFSNTLGDKVSDTVQGRYVSVGYIVHAYAGCVGSQGDVYIDGALAGSYSCDGLTAPMNSLNGAAWGCALKTFDTGVDGPHTVEVRVGVAGKRVYVDDFRGSNQPSVKVRVGKVIEMGPVAYSSVGSSPTNVAALNAIIDDVVADFQSMGHDVYIVNTHDSLNNTTDLASDQVHPNDIGHGKLFDVFKTAVTGPYDVTYPTVNGETLTIHFTANGLAESWSES